MFVIEEIDLRSDHAQIMQTLEESLLCFGGAKFLRVAPKPETDTLLPGIINQFFYLRIAPTRPESLNHVIFEAEFSGPAAEILHLFESVAAAIQIFPDRAARLDPGSIDALRQKFWVRWRRQIANSVRIYERVQIFADHDHAPWSSDRAANLRGRRSSIDVVAVAQAKG